MWSMCFDVVFHYRLLYFMLALSTFPDDIYNFINFTTLRATLCVLQRCRLSCAGGYNTYITANSFSTLNTLFCQVCKKNTATHTNKAAAVSFISSAAHFAVVVVCPPRCTPQFTRRPTKVSAPTVGHDGGLESQVPAHVLGRLARPYAESSGNAA